MNDEARNLSFGLHSTFPHSVFAIDQWQPQPVPQEPPPLDCGAGQA
jgi:hypothetical protein